MTWLFNIQLKVPVIPEDITYEYPGHCTYINFQQRAFDRIRT